MTNATWKLKELEQWIKANLPNEKQAATLPNSLGRSSLIIKYHVNSARDAFARFKDSDDSHSQMLAAMLTSKSDFGIAALAYEANIIAAIHTVRNYADIFAQLVNSLVMATPLAEKDCTFGKVANGIPESVLKQGMLDLNSSYWFRYLAAFSNISKHRRMLYSKPTVSFEDGASGIRVEPFSYAFTAKESATDFPQHWGHELLEETYNVYVRIIGLGQELNSQVVR
ncbi:hypothetical protein [Pseudomonas asiatica]|uniref:hypothetical protein n=1 Tax=Pseudomonas asiatica TaxID=2219225 RepID=UPI0010C0F04A|nr:hypothetical protein [Pseudomonas asiatica]